MNIVTEINDWFAIRKKLSAKKIGLVHTMGNLHAGHMSLFARSQLENDITVAVIFINPTQFNHANDFNFYPRTLEQDKKNLMAINVDYLLLFDEKSLYPDQYAIKIFETDISQELEGEHRPGHFTGMLTIVLKILNLVKADNSYYGEKDYQQLLLIKKMSEALFLETNIIGCPIIRDTDNLALSSRNSRLTIEQRNHAMHFPRLLQSKFSVEQIVDELKKLNFKVDYVVEKWQRRLAAVWLGDVRLIDNFDLGDY